MSETNVMLVIPEEKVRIQGKIAYIRTGLTVEQLILKLMLFATQDEPVMIVEKEGERMSVKREMVSGIMNEAMRLERNLQCITSALEMLHKVDGSVKVDVCIPRLERACDELYEKISSLYNRYDGRWVEELTEATVTKNAQVEPMPCPFCGIAMELRESEEGERFVHPVRGCLLNGQGWVNNILNRELWNRRAATDPKTIHGTVQGVKFKECEVYPSSIEGVRYGVKSVHQVKESICLVVYRLTPAAFIDGRTSYFYMAVVDEDDDSRATVLMDDGFTTIYAEDE